MTSNIDMSKFIFHSGRTPLGSADVRTIEIPIGGATTLQGRTVWSELIPTSTNNLAPRVTYTIPSGTWYPAVGSGTIPAGTRLVNTPFRYQQSPYPTLRDVTINPIMKHEEGGIRIGVYMYMGFSGTNPGSVTVPTRDLEFRVSLDVIPRSLK